MSGDPTKPLFDMNDPRVAQYFGGAQAAPAPVDFAPLGPAPAPAPHSSAALAEYWGQSKTPAAPANDFGLGLLSGPGPTTPAGSPAAPAPAPSPLAQGTYPGAMTYGSPAPPPPRGVSDPGVSNPNEDPSRMMSVAAPPGSAPGAPSGGMSIDPRPPPKPAAHGPSSGGGGMGDFGIGARRKEVYGTFEREKGDIQGLADVERARADAKAAGMGVMGADQIAQAARMQEEAETQDRIFQAYGDETNKQLDLVRSRQVDTSRLMRDGGTKAAAIIGGVLGGIYQGLNKTAKNPFIDDLNGMIAQDIGVQEREIDRDIRTTLERKSLLGTMRDVYKDKQLARMQAQALYYEGFKQQLLAEVAQYDSPAIQERANAAVTMVDRQLGSLKLNDAMQNAARAAAQAAFLRSEAQRKFDNYIKFEDMTSRRFGALGYDKGDQISPRFVPTGQDPQTGEALGFLAGNAEEAIKMRKANSKMMQVEALSNKALALRAEMTTLGRAVHNQNMYGLYTPDWQQELRSVENQLTGGIKELMELGALDNGVERFAKPITGNLDSVGSGADVRLKALMDTVRSNRETMVQSVAGPRARSDGMRVRVEGGVAAAPMNQQGSQGVQREAP